MAWPSERVDSEIEYLRADDPVPTVRDVRRSGMVLPREFPIVDDDEDWELAPEPRERDTSASVTIPIASELILVLAVGVVLAAIIAALRYGGRGGFGRRLAGADGADEADGGVLVADPRFTNPDDPDPTAALIALNRLALLAAARRARLTVRRGWTARDVLARLPGDLPHLPQLVALAKRAEAAQFAGRAVGQVTLKSHRTAITPLLREDTA